MYLLMKFFNSEGVQYLVIVTESEMKSDGADELKQAQADFRRLQKDQQLPPLMQLKLAFLQALLNEVHNSNDFGEKLDAP